MKVQLLDHSVPDVLTPMETAKILHIGRNSIYLLLAKKEIQSFRVGSKILIPKTFLQDFIAKSSGMDYHNGIQMAENLSCCREGEDV